MIPIIVQAKSGSKRVPYKNTLTLPGHRYNLTDWALLAGSTLRKIFQNLGKESDLIIATGFEIDSFAREHAFPVRYVPRPKLLDGDRHENRMTIAHALSSSYRADLLDEIEKVIILQPSAPFRCKESINSVAANALTENRPWAMAGSYHVTTPERIFHSLPWSFKKIMIPYDRPEGLDIDTYADVATAAEYVEHYGLHQDALVDRITGGDSFA